ncbi:uncharacterized protein LOC8282137 [Ricinus communis]|uniref:DUF538 domain-containing protein n=1 Tax=Ricinus communis TaxID=3988 RepID=B9SBL0_RICCO|nr:uncharacterized protein LOC8282137 [Ricinus communis]EEF38958.1 conserved hypothetical protein [Ricinus communis]|eukprot:XP_002523379.1 uncharacterized protein LOC8282137 [Ricinus communis]
MAEREAEGAVVRKGQEGLKLAISLYEEFGLPLGLLPLEDVIEVGFVRSNGYMWILQEKKVVHKFKMIGKLVSYDTEITCYIENKRIKKLKGVKARELFIWTPCGEIFVDDPASGKTRFKAIGGLTVAFPAEAFALGQ